MGDRAGHSSSWFTADTYAHVGNARAREAGDRIGAVISLAAARATREAAGTVAPAAGPPTSGHRTHPAAGAKPQVMAEARGFEPRMGDKPKPH